MTVRDRSVTHATPLPFLVPGTGGPRRPEYRLYLYFVRVPLCEYSALVRASPLHPTEEIPRLFGKDLLLTLLLHTRGPLFVPLAKVLSLVVHGSGSPSSRTTPLSWYPPPPSTGSPCSLVCLEKRSGFSSGVWNGARDRPLCRGSDTCGSPTVSRALDTLPSCHQRGVPRCPTSSVKHGRRYGRSRPYIYRTRGSVDRDFRGRNLVADPE